MRWPLFVEVPQRLVSLALVFFGVRPCVFDCRSHGFRLETMANRRLDDKYMMKPSSDVVASELVDAIQICLAAAAQKMKAEKAARKRQQQAESNGCALGLAGCRSASVQPAEVVCVERSTCTCARVCSSALCKPDLKMGFLRS